MIVYRRKIIGKHFIWPITSRNKVDIGLSVNSIFGHMKQKRMQYEINVFAYSSFMYSWPLYVVLS